MVAPRFADCAIAAAGIVPTRPRRQRAAAPLFRPASPDAMLRRKEWTLLLRDPWLVSQTLMQLLYLLPPAFLLWRSFGERQRAALILLVPVLVMAAGQLAGGLAWLAISGEDAPELVATAPLPPSGAARQDRSGHGRAWRWCFRPFMLALALVSPSCRPGRRHRHRRSRGVGDRDPALLSRPGEAQPIPAPPDLVARRDLRRGLLVDRLGGAAALAAAGTWIAVIPAIIAVAILAGTSLVRPRAAFV